MRIVCFARPFILKMMLHVKKNYNKQISAYFGKRLGVINRIRQLIPAPGRHVGKSLFPLINNALLPFFSPPFRFQVNTVRRDCGNYLTLQLLDCPCAFLYRFQWKY